MRRVMKPVERKICPENRQEIAFRVHLMKPKGRNKFLFSGQIEKRYKYELFVSSASERLKRDTVILKV